MSLDKCAVRKALFQCHLCEKQCLGTRGSITSHLKTDHGLSILEYEKLFKKQKFTLCFDMTSGK